MRPLLFALVLTVLFFARPAAAFNADEHQYLSNLALRIALNDCRSAECPEVAVAARLHALAEGRQESFGAVTSLADYIRDVSPLFDSDQHTAAGGELDWNLLHDLRRDTLRFLQAASLNEHHFRRQALVTHLLNHEAAISEARAGRWTRAVLFEAYALHFLQDFLSPGHVATPRTGLADFVAIGWHDQFGARGLDFVLARDETMRRLSHVAFLPPETQARRGLVLGPADFASICELMEKGRTVHFTGDGRLRTNHDQAALAVLLSARSIGEVLRARTVDETDFRRFDFRGDKRAAMVAGRYDLRSVGGTALFAPGEVLIVTVQNAWNDAGRAGEGGAGARSIAVESLLLGMAPFTAQDRPSTRWMRWAYRSITPAVLYGVTKNVGSRTKSSSAHVRIALTIPRTNLQVSAIGGVRRVEGATAGGGARHPIKTGASLDAGFGFLYVRFGAETDLTRRPLGGTQKNVILTTGISAVIPTRTVLGYLRR